MRARGALAAKASGQPKLSAHDLTPIYGLLDHHLAALRPIRSVGELDATCQPLQRLKGFQTVAAELRNGADELELVVDPWFAHPGTDPYLAPTGTQWYLFERTAPACLRPLLVPVDLRARVTAPT